MSEPSHIELPQDELPQSEAQPELGVSQPEQSETVILHPEPEPEATQAGVQQFDGPHDKVQQSEDPQSEVLQAEGQPEVQQEPEMHPEPDVSQEAQQEVTPR